MPTSSQAAIATGEGTFVIDTLEVSSPQPDEVLVAIKAAGLCRTDYNSLYWGKPVVMGHEGAGVVVAVGSEVSHVQEGDAVVLNWATPCGQCFQCQEGHEHLCEINSPLIAGASGPTPGHAHWEGTRWKDEPIERAFNIGTLSEYTLVKASAVVKNPQPDMPFPSASIVSCSVMTGYGSVIRAANVKAGSSVVVIGTGGVGFNIIQGAKLRGAAMIIAVDVNPQRLEMARQFGATHTLTADPVDEGLLYAAKEVRELTGGRGADYAFECTAIAALGSAPLAMIRNAGTAVQVSGIEQEVAFDMHLLEWDKLYINPLYGQCRPQIDFPQIIHHYAQGEWMLDEMVTQTYTLDQLQEALDDLISGKNAKGVVVFE